MPRDHNMYCSRGSVLSSNKLKRTNDVIIPLTRKATSVSSVQKPKIPPALRRKDLKSLTYLNDTINDSITPIKLKSCLSKQKQSNKLKMKVKFYIKKKDNKLHHMTHTKSAHCLNKIKTMVNDEDLKALNNAMIITTNQGYLNRQKSKTKLNKRHMAGDNNFIQANAKSIKDINNSLTNKIKNMIFEKNRRLPDTSFKICRKSLTPKHSSSYSSILEYKAFKSKLLKKDVMNQFLSHTLSHSTMKKPKLTVEKINPQLRSSQKTSIKKQRYGRSKKHLPNGLSRTINPKTDIFTTCYQTKRNLSAFFYQDICVTGKKLTLWAKQKKSNKRSEHNFQKNSMSCPEISKQSLNNGTRQLNTTRHRQIRQHRLNKLKLWGDMTIHKNKTILPRSTNVKANLYVCPEISSDYLDNKSRISSYRKSNQPKRRVSLARTSDLSKECTGNNTTRLGNSKIVENKSRHNNCQTSQNLIMPPNKALVNSLKELCFELQESYTYNKPRNEKKRQQNTADEQKPYLKPKNSTEYPRIQSNATKNNKVFFSGNYDVQSTSVINQTLSHIFSRNKKKKQPIHRDSIQKSHRRSKKIDCDCTRRSKLLLRDMECDCSDGKNKCSCLSVTLIEPGISRQEMSFLQNCKEFSTEGNLSSNKQITCKKLINCVNKLINKRNFNKHKSKRSKIDDIFDKFKIGINTKKHKSDCEFLKEHLRNMNKRTCCIPNTDELPHRIKMYNDDYKQNKLRPKPARYNINKLNQCLTPEDSGDDLNRDNQKNRTRLNLKSEYYNKNKTHYRHPNEYSSNDVTQHRDNIDKITNTDFETEFTNRNEVSSDSSQENFVTKFNMKQHKTDLERPSNDFGDEENESNTRLFRISKRQTPNTKRYNKNISDDDFINKDFGSKYEMYHDNSQRNVIKRYNRSRDKVDHDTLSIDSDYEYDENRTRNKQKSNRRWNPNIKRFNKKFADHELISEDSDNDLINDVEKYKRKQYNQPKWSPQPERYRGNKTDYDYENEYIDDDFPKRKVFRNQRSERRRSPKRAIYHKNNIDRNIVSEDSDDDIDTNNSNYKNSFIGKIKSWCSSKPDKLPKQRQYNNDDLVKRKTGWYRNLKRELQGESATESTRNNEKGCNFGECGMRYDKMGRLERLLAGFTSKKGNNYVSEVLKYALNSMDPDEVKVEMKNNKTKIQLIKEKDSESSNMKQETQLNKSKLQCFYHTPKEKSQCSCKMCNVECLCLKPKRKLLSKLNYLHHNNESQKHYNKKKQTKSTKLPVTCYKMLSAFVNQKFTGKDLYAQTLSKRPCFIIYKLWPRFYPHFLNCIQYIKQATRLCLFGLAFACWAPVMFVISLCLYFLPR